MQRNLVKKIRDTKGIFHVMIGSIKDRSRMATHSSNLAWKIPQTEEPGGLQSMGSQRVRHDWGTSLSLSTEAEYIKKRWQENTELHRKNFHNLDNHGVMTHLEPDILECEVKWILGSITAHKASGGDDIPLELFQILKDDPVKVV